MEIYYRRQTVYDGCIVSYQNKMKEEREREEVTKVNIIEIT